jgi:hypothetical protein
MKSLAEIERELRQLRQRVRELEGDPEALNAEGIADNSDENSQRQAGQPARVTARQQSF